MSHKVAIIAILSPKPGKTDRLEELLAGIAKDVYEKEPDTYRYHVHKEMNADPPMFSIMETYKDKAAQEFHTSTPHFKQFFAQAKEEDLFASDPQVCVVEPVSGFDSR